MAKTIIAGEVVHARDVESAQKFSSGNKPTEGELFDILTPVRNGKRLFHMYDLGGRHFNAVMNAMSPEGVLAIATSQRVKDISVFFTADDVAKITKDGYGSIFVYVEKYIEPKAQKGVETHAPQASK